MKSSQTIQDLEALSEDIKTSEELHTSFQRYSIPKTKAPHRYPVPHPFVPKVKKIGLTKILVKELFEHNFRLIKKEYRQAIMSRPCIYGVFGGKLGGLFPIKELCTGCMRCVWEYPDVCRVDQNPEFLQFSDSYFLSSDPKLVMSSPFSIIWYEASTGKIQVKGMGYKGLFSSKGWDKIWTDMSEIVRPTRDGIYGREYISTSVNLGSKPSFVEFPISQNNTTDRAIDLPIPILFDYLPQNQSSEDTKSSIQHAAKIIDTAYITSDISDENSNAIHYLVDYKSPEFSEIENVNAIMIDHDPIGIKKLLDEFSDKTIISKIRLSENASSQCIEAVQSGADVLYLYADYHGMGYGKEINTFVSELMQNVHLDLINKGLRSKTSIILSGGIILAEHVPKAIICGADVVAINSTILVALQSKFDGEFQNRTHSRILPDSFEVNWGTKRLTNLISSWHHQLIEILSAMGIKDVRRLTGETGRAMFNDELEEEAFHDITKID